MRRARLSAVVLACGLCACASKRPGTPDNEPTLKTLAGREVALQADPGIRSDEEKAIAAYRAFLAAAPGATQRAEALRRLGDLEMDGAENRFAEGQGRNGAPDYRAAIQQY